MNTHPIRVFSSSYLKVSYKPLRKNVFPSVFGAIVVSQTLISENSEIKFTFTIFHFFIHSCLSMAAKC